MHGGYRKLKSFQLAQLCYDVTSRFCDRYIDKRSRTHDQMVQAARSGVQNIAEGSKASGTSKKSELKLTNVARASLEELRLNYEDFLRQRGFRLWSEDDPRRKELVLRRCATAEAVAEWVHQVHERQRESILPRTSRQRRPDPHRRSLRPPRPPTPGTGHRLRPRRRLHRTPPPHPKPAAPPPLNQPPKP